MGRLQERIRQAEQRREAAAEGSDDRRAVDAEIAALRALDSEGFGLTEAEMNETVRTRVNESRTTGETEARRAQARRLGVAVEGLDDELDRLAEVRRNAQSETDREREAREAAETERDAARQEGQQATTALERYRTDEAITQALDGKNLRPGKRGMALRAIDRSGISRGDDGNLSGVTEAVDALVEEESGWFTEAPPDNPPETPQGRERTTTTGESQARKWAKNALAKTKR